jgi:hypothetical protein
MQRYSVHIPLTGLLLGIVLFMLHTGPLTGHELPAGVRRVKNSLAQSITISPAATEQRVVQSGGYTSTIFPARSTF